MTETSLSEDLIRHFQEEKESLEKEIALVDPMASAIRKPAAAHFFQSSFLLILQCLAWILVLAGIGLILFMDKVAPFYYLSQMAHDNDIIQKYRQQDLEMLEWTIKGLVALLALLFFFSARMLGSIRHKNRILHLTGKNLKLLMERYFHRRAGIAQLGNKYPVELPENSDGIALPPPPSKLNGDEDILL